MPPREHGGNCDIKDLSRGSKIFFPVYVDGAGLSVGDLHFSQGDGEITFCGAIEMAGWVHMKVSLIKGGMAKYGIKNPIFKPSPITPNYNDYLIFEGISVDEQGKQHYLDVHVAYRQACLNAIEYLKKFGYSGAQAYSILGTAPVQGHISGVVDVPNACATLWLPTADLRLRHQPLRRPPPPPAPPPREPLHAALCHAHPSPGPTSQPPAPIARRPRARVFAAMPRLACLSSETRRAMETNERARHEPKSSGSYPLMRHPAGCGCCSTGKRGATVTGANGAKAFPSKRPWMISH